MAESICTLIANQLQTLGFYTAQHSSHLSPAERLRAIQLPPG